MRAIESHLKWLTADAYLGWHSIRVNAQFSGNFGTQLDFPVDGLRRLAVRIASHPCSKWNGKPAANVTFPTFRQRNEMRSWRSDPREPMFSLVNRRLIRMLIYALVAGQMLLSAPIASAMSSGASAGTAEMPCAESMPQTDDSKPCPCCPDGTASVAACLSACAASVAALPAPAPHIVRMVALPASVTALPKFADLADPPLKPPPIV